MSEQFIDVSEGLWLVWSDVPPEYDDGFITIRDDTGGDVLIDRSEIPALIEALKTFPVGEMANAHGSLP